MSVEPIVLRNDQIEAEIDVEGGAAIVRLESRCLKPGFNVLDRRGLQCWLKTGERRDALSGVLRRFYDREWVSGAFSVSGRSACAVTVAVQDGSIELAKRISLVDDKLVVETHVTNRGSETSPALQVEHIGQFRGGRMPGRDRTVLLRLEEDDTPREARYLEEFGQRFGEAHDPDGSRLGVGFIREGLLVSIGGSGNSERLVGFCRANIVARGVTSDRFRLRSGESFRHTQTVRLGPLKEGAWEHPRRPGKRPDPGSWLVGEPVFEERWSHVCLQYDRVVPEDVRRVIGGLLVPWRYTGVIFEVGHGVRTQAHPELAAESALTGDEMRGLVQFAREQGLKVGIEFNTPGHQRESGIARVYPELIEPQPPGSRACPLCLTHPDARVVVAAVIEELLDTHRPDVWLIGGDEVQIDGEPGSMGHCPRCRGRKPFELVSDYLQWLTGLRGPSDMRVAMFGDMFIRSEQFGPNVSGNATAGETWRALDLLPPKVEIMDWHYYPAPAYGSIEYFREHQRVVWPGTAFNLEGIRSFLGYAAERGVSQALHTTWAVPNQEKLPIESMVWAALYHWLGGAADELDVREIALDWCRSFWEGTGP